MNEVKRPQTWPMSCRNAKPNLHQAHTQRHNVVKCFVHEAMFKTYRPKQSDNIISTISSNYKVKSVVFIKN